MLSQFALLIALLCACVAAMGQQPAPSAFHTHREAADDLEAMGIAGGLAQSASVFVSRAWVAGLPQTSMMMNASEDYPDLPKSGVLVRGVALGTLVKSLKADPAASVVQAICRDGYVATYSREYIRQHKPLVILQIDGMDLGAWARKNNQYDAEPYLIGYGRFVPAFHVLAHQDQPLEPSEIVALRFATAERVFAAIVPKTSSLPAMQGYRIARQNCFRCHNADSAGGTKAGVTWSKVGRLARDRPEDFAAWVMNPQAVDPKAEMPPNPKYDRATLLALQRYFTGFATEGQ